MRDCRPSPSMVPVLPSPPSDLRASSKSLILYRFYGYYIQAVLGTLSRHTMHGCASPKPMAKRYRSVRVLSTTQAYDLVTSRVAENSWPSLRTSPHNCFDHRGNNEDNSRSEEHTSELQSPD